MSQARAIDVFRALSVIDWQHSDDYRIVLRINLVASRDDEMLFDRVFATYFGYLEAEHDGDANMARSELLRGKLYAGGRSFEAHRDMLTEADSFSVEAVARRAISPRAGIRTRRRSPRLSAHWPVVWPPAPRAAARLRGMARASICAARCDAACAMALIW